jgi:phosphatidylinositol 3-kinase
MPIKTAYKYIEKKPWLWDEWLTLPLKISDLPRNSQLAITVWDIETPERGDIPVCGATISMFDKYGEFRQGKFELRMWQNKMADGNTRSTTPGILSDVKFDDLVDIDEKTANDKTKKSNSSIIMDEFPILDELDRLAKMSKMHSNGQMIKQDWLDKRTFAEIQNAMGREKNNGKFLYLTIELPFIKCEDTKFIVLYYEEDAEKIIQTIPTNEIFVVNDPELELDNIIELKHRKLEHSKYSNLNQNLKPDLENKNLLTKIVNYPVTRNLKPEEHALMWKYRYYLTQNKKALTKFLQCFDLNLEFEGNIFMDLLLKWQPMDVEDALELLGSKYRNHPKIRSYAISRLKLASNEDLILYLLQLIQALRYENFNRNDTNPNLAQINNNSIINNDDLKESTNDTTNQENVNLQNTPESLSKQTFELDLKEFLLQRATQNELVALNLYWFVKVEIKDNTTTLKGSTSSNIQTGGGGSSLNNNPDSISAVPMQTVSGSTNNNNNLSNQNISNNNNNSTLPNNNSSDSKSNFIIFMDEMLDKLKNVKLFFVKKKQFF